MVQDRWNSPMDCHWVPRNSNLFEILRVVYYYYYYRYRDTGANLLGTVDDRRPGGCIPLCLRLLCGYYVNVSIARIFSSCFNDFWRGRWEYETAVMGVMRVVLPRRGGSSDFPKSKRLLESFWRQYVRSVVQNQVPTALGTVVAAIAAVAAAAVAAVVPLAL